MEVKVSMSYLDDEKYSVKNTSGNELVVDMYEKGKKENLSPMELLLSAVTTCAAVEVVSMIKKRRRDFKDIKAKTSGVRAETHPMYYKKISVKYIIYSNDQFDICFSCECSCFGVWVLHTDDWWRSSKRKRNAM